MGLSSLYNKLALTSPYFEVMLRKLYWRNVKRLRQFKPNNHSTFSAELRQPANFDKIKEWLIQQGVKDGSLLVVHSSYDEMAGCGLKPNEIIHELRNLIGESGTLAMPVIRHYKELPSPEEWLKADFSGIVCRYDPRRTPVSSGLIPSMLMREKGAVVSMHPLNTMAAVGPLAEAMMEHNLDGEKPTPHGPNSSWKFCADHDAIIVALGVPMIHHLTIAHVPEDNSKDWPIKEWYNDIQFDIVQPDKTVIRKTVRERKPKWGLIHDAELNFGKDLERAGIMHLSKIDGINVGVVHSRELLDYMKSRKNKSYPYYKLF